MSSTQKRKMPEALAWHGGSYQLCSCRFLQTGAPVDWIWTHTWCPRGPFSREEKGKPWNLKGLNVTKVMTETTNQPHLKGNCVTSQEYEWTWLNFLLPFKKYKEVKLWTEPQSKEDKWWCYLDEAFPNAHLDIIRRKLSKSKLGLRDERHPCNTDHHSFLLPFKSVSIHLGRQHFLPVCFWKELGTYNNRRAIF